MYANGQGVLQNNTEAAKWFRKAAKQGFALAQYSLGFLYEDGQGVLQDYDEAAKWYRMAAEQGYGSAQINLGIMYVSGKGVPQNIIQAYKWLSISSANGNERGRKGRDIIAKRMTPAQIAKAQELALEWTLRSGQ